MSVGKSLEQRIQEVPLGTVKFEVGPEGELRLCIVSMTTGALVGCGVAALGFLVFTFIESFPREMRFITGIGCAVMLVLAILLVYWRRIASKAKPLAILDASGIWLHKANVKIPWSEFGSFQIETRNTGNGSYSHLLVQNRLNEPFPPLTSRATNYEVLKIWLEKWIHEKGYLSEPDILDAGADKG